MGNRQRAAGFSLLEALVSMLVLSIGALGVAGLQAVGMKNAQSIKFRGAASLQIESMIDRIGANVATLRSNDASEFVDGSFANVACATVSASTELARWRRQVDCAMPGALGRVAFDRRTNTLTVGIRWDDSRAGGSAVQEFFVETRP